MKSIAVIGAGSTGLAVAADLSLEGFKVTLFEEPKFKESLEAVSKSGGIEIHKDGRNYFTPVNKVTSNIKDTMENSKIIIVAVPATRHESIFEQFVSFLKDEHTIIISPGNAGSLVLSKMLKERKINCKCMLAEVESNLYVCKITAPARVELLLPRRPRYIAAFPAKNTSKVIDELNGIFETKPATNVMEAALNLPNIDCHLVGSLLNTGAIEQAGSEFRFYDQGLTPSVVKGIEALYRERVAVIKELGYNNRVTLKIIQDLAKGVESPEFSTFRKIRAPGNMKHRYIEEDAYTGIPLIISLGYMLGVNTPFAKSLLYMVSAIKEVDYLAVGRTLDRLGIRNMTCSELNSYLYEGK